MFLLITENTIITENTFDLSWIDTREGGGRGGCLFRPGRVLPSLTSRQPQARQTGRLVLLLARCLSPFLSLALPSETSLCSHKESLAVAGLLTYQESSSPLLSCCLRPDLVNHGAYTSAFSLVGRLPRAISNPPIASGGSWPSPTMTNRSSPRSRMTATRRYVVCSMGVYTPARPAGPPCRPPWICALVAEHLFG